MSFAEYHDEVREGDVVIFSLGGPDNMAAVTMKAGAVYQNVHGVFPHSTVIGKRFGARVSGTKGGNVQILYPTPELWTITLPHRTQILYDADISIVCLKLALTPGCVVVESGTGSGSLSHAMARCIAPNGHLHTFEFHKQRMLLAKKEFESHGISDVVTVRHRDACGEGFAPVRAEADAVFLDLPSPHDAIKHAARALKPGVGRLCSFSPCIEQIQRACDVMRETGFTQIFMVECLTKTYDVRRTEMPIAEGFDMPPEVACTALPAANSNPNSKKGAARPGKRKLEASHVSLTARPLKESKGHTGYLAFAEFHPSAAVLEALADDAS